MVAYSEEMNITSQFDDKVPNGLKCQLRCFSNTNNVPTTYVQGKLNSILVVIISLIHVNRISMVTNTHLS